MCEQKDRVLIRPFAYRLQIADPRVNDLIKHFDACNYACSLFEALCSPGHNMDASAEDLPHEAGPQKNREEAP